MDDHLAASWSLDRRLDYLIKSEIQAPASVDSDVWPQILQPIYPHPLWLWFDITYLSRSFRGQPSPKDLAPVLIEIAVVIEEKTGLYWTNRFSGLVPEVLPIGAKSSDLGFDIADQYLLSGLNNCKLHPHVLESLRLEWSDKINARGLVTTEIDALVLAAVYSDLVPEHAPFSAYRIREISLPI